MIHVTVQSDRHSAIHDDCGWTQCAVGDNFCGGCGVDMRKFWAATRRHYAAGAPDPLWSNGVPKSRQQLAWEWKLCGNCGHLHDGHECREEVDHDSYQRLTTVRYCGCATFKKRNER